MSRQPDSGFRSGLDAVMLAAAVPARPGETCWNWVRARARQPVPGGAGAGHVPSPAWKSIRSWRRWPAATRASTAWQCHVRRAADIFALPPELKRDFDQVFCNPPFMASGQASPDAARARALSDDGQLAATG